jgi:hypothetical protein
MDPTKPILSKFSLKTALNDNYKGCFYRDVTIKNFERHDKANN